MRGGGGHDRNAGVEKGSASGEVSKVKTRGFPDRLNVDCERKKKGFELSDQPLTEMGNGAVN